MYLYVYIHVNVCMHACMHAYGAHTGSSSIWVKPTGLKVRIKVLGIEGKGLVASDLFEN